MISEETIVEICREYNVSKPIAWEIAWEIVARIEKLQEEESYSEMDQGE